MNIFETYFMLAAVQEMPLEHTYFKDRYFPTDLALDVFGTSRVLADYKGNSQKAAPFVLPRAGAVPVARDGFSTYDLEPANIAVSIPLTLDQLQHRGFGESLLSQATPEERAQYFLMHDLAELSAMISRTEEKLAIDTMLDNGCTMRHRTENADVYSDIAVRFYDGANNPAQFTPGSAWSHSTYVNGTWTPGNWYADICTMISMLTSKGRPASEILVSADVGDFLMEDGWVLEMLNNRRVEFGLLSPETLTPFVTQLGAINFKGRVLPILASSGTYNNGTTDVAYMPAGSVIVTAPNCGSGLYGAVTQMEANGEWVTFAGRRVPMHYFTQRPPVSEVQMSARPLFVPKTENPWTVAKSVLA